jgi:hypothetical protein
MPGGIETTFVLVPSKNYAIVSYLTTGQGKSVTFRKYSDYRLVSGQWIPMTILIEKYDSETDRLLARDLWTITSIDTNVPGVENFQVNYELDALVEFYSPVTAKPAMYRNSGAIDTEALLAERFAYALSQGINTQNCATIALKYALSKIGRSVSQTELSSLISSSTGSTSIAAMKQFVEGKGFYSRAVKTDIQTLKNLKGCQAILHIPGKSHFVILEAVDDKYVWTIDLANDKFYYPTDKNFFGMDWTEGIALLVSKQPIAHDSNFIELPSDEQTNIIGSAGYSCTKLLQNRLIIQCSQPVPGECTGYYKEYYERWGCTTAESGSCSTSIMVRYRQSPCINDPYYPTECADTGEFTFYYMRACQ